MSRILVIEDEPIIRTELRRLLTRAGHDVAEAGAVPEAAAEHALDAFDLVISDLRLPGPPGTDIIGLCPGVPVLIMTSYATVKSAVDAMKLGAVDYIAKPFDHDELLLQVERVLREGRLTRQNAALKREVEQTWAPGGMVGTSPAMRDVFERVRKVASSAATVLVLGESGTGKELVARAVHAQSPRAEGPMVAVNCAAIPEGLLESELFGHEKGAFTGAQAAHAGLVEAAHGGTLFLDEIGELPAPAQARLLRMLQDGEVRRVGATRSRKVDVRILAATHRDLPRRVQEGLFRQDLYFRLRVVEIRLPPLRERGEDLPALAKHLLEKATRRLGRPPASLSPEALAAIAVHPWPGNVRELENALERAVILADGPLLTPDLLALELPGAAATDVPPAAMEELDFPPLVAGEDPRSPDSMEEYFRRFVLEHQDRMGETELARRLGISRKTLWEKRQRLGIPRTRA
ncbi:sigma-54-dependent Fis family transcriptional regulator [Corallococcus praedator]|uniref:Sigma-54-dependent Fis family transcriptional regulator n=1 Tax=Corallococcus praedator TaxID=2316724 RepID=A0ABX9QPA1_9BACT|nr:MULTISPECIES: sigma-54 dependent transcriptional regulator [Corallococcus]RKH18061.1 sigma-54-dependent Fis family transcriptional regulator [Corallococcus sp. CA047B]RKH34191.1 sigma-54-dependent Fis family transcriptional regulator [Corallococcus sp. CA031C]RKI12959.1 sigma-54-dependent Fis family transcriptional regulator [Corallococcus praedator]